MVRVLFRLAATTLLLAVAAIAVGFTAYYLLEPSPYRHVAAIDPRIAPRDVFRDLTMNRTVPARFGPHNIVSSDTVERLNFDDGAFGSVATSELVTRLFVHSRTTYSSSPVIVPLTVELRRFPDPLQARIALLRMMLHEQSLGHVSNPIKGHMYKSQGWPVAYRWVDGVWLGRLEAYNGDFMSLLVSWVPYVETESNPAEFAQARPFGTGQPFVLPALFLILAAGIWPVAASRVLKVRPRRNVRKAPADELIADLEALNAESRSWTVNRSGTADFVAEWKVVDRSWQSLFGRAGLSRARSLRLRLQPSSATVKAVEERYVVAIDGKWRANVAVSIGKRWSFTVDLLGWLSPTTNPGSASRPVGSDERFASYDVVTIKRTIAEIVLRAGWSYQPAILMGWS